MTPSFPPCRECGGSLQRIAAMPGHVVCGSGHLFLEAEALSVQAQASQASQAASAPLTRVGGDRRHPGRAQNQG